MKLKYFIAFFYSQILQVIYYLCVFVLFVCFQVSPIIINTVITIQSALTPTAETHEEEHSPVPVKLWEKQSWKELKMWFLEEESDEDTKSLTPLIPQGESLKVPSFAMGLGVCV